MSYKKTCLGGAPVIDTFLYHYINSECVPYLGGC